MSKVKNSYYPPSGTSIIVVANYSALPDPTTVSGKFYWAEASQGTSWLPGGLGGTYYNSGMYYSNGVSWSFVNVPYQATQAEVNTGTNTDKFVTPDTLKNSSQWALKSNLATSERLIAFDRTGNTVVGTASADQILGSLEVLGNTFLAEMDSILDIPLAKSSGTSAEYKVYVNTANNLTGATQIALYSATNQRTIPLVRKMLITGGTLDMLSSATQSQVSNYGFPNTGTPTTPITYDPTVTHYFIVTCTNSDTVVASIYKTMKITAWTL